MAKACNSPLLPVDKAKAEKLITLKEAAAMFPQRPSRKVLYQWRTRGVENRYGEIVYLEHVRYGGSIYTTVEAVARFERRCNGEEV